MAATRTMPPAKFYIIPCRGKKNSTLENEKATQRKVNGRSASQGGSSQRGVNQPVINSYIAKQNIDSFSLNLLIYFYLHRV